MASPLVKFSYIHHLEAHVSLNDTYAGCCVPVETPQLISVGKEFNQNAEYTTEDTGPLTVVCACPTISSGNITIDLTDIEVVGGTSAGSVSHTESMATSIPVYIYIKAPSTNVAALEIKPAAANGYALFGTGNTDGQIIQPDSYVILDRFNSDMPTVSASAKDITVVDNSQVGDKLLILMLFKGNALIIDDGGGLLKLEDFENDGYLLAE